MKNYTMAIDPSINYMGYALYTGKRLTDYELLKPKGLGEDKRDPIKKSVYLFNIIKDRMREYKREGNKVTLVLEIPEYWDTAGYVARESGSIFKLTFLCGMICSIPKIITYTPSGWKGQLPKDVMCRRLDKKFPKLDLVKMDHNIVDAIGIGYKHIFGRV